jgi:stage II sporulation protein D
VSRTTGIGAAIVVAAAVVAAGAGTARLAASPLPDRAPSPRSALDEQLVRIALAIGVREARATATSLWRVYESDGSTVIADGQAGDVWRFEHRGRRIRAVRLDGAVTEYYSSPLIVRAAGWGGFVVHAGRRYRGELLVHASDAGVTVVNRLPVDEYLKGVVPMEIGDTRTMVEFAAAEAQAVAARSYAYVRLPTEPDGRWYDLRPSVVDQVYGGEIGRAHV